MILINLTYLKNNIMKKVFSNSSDVMHVFVARTQTEGKSSNVFFYNDKIYSYGHHYLLAEFIKNNSGAEAILINNTGYSVTTSKHISEIRSASRQYKQFFTLSADSGEVLQQLENLISKLEKAKKPELYINEANILYSSFINFLDWSEKNISEYPLIVSAYSVFETKDIKKYFAEKEEKIKLAEKLRIAKELKLAKERLNKFFAYEVNTVNGLPEDFLRISQDNTLIETTQGVKIPIDNARILYKMIKAKRDIKGYIIKGTYSDYTVISINGVLKVGCHHINVKNMKKVGEQIIRLSNQSNK